MGKITKRFSLIEMIVVIGIIAVLIAITMPVFTSIREKAKETKAKAEMNAIETAVKSFEMTYGVLPMPDGTEAVGSSGLVDTSNTEYPDLMTFLTNVGAPGKSVDVVGNDRGIRFLDVPNDYTTKGFVDPWGNDYTVYLDTDYNGQIADPEGGSTPLYGTIFIYADANGSSADRVYSWK